MPFRGVGVSPPGAPTSAVESRNAASGESVLCGVEMIGAEHSPGMEVTSGSLGLGLSQAVGVALARKLKQETGRVWVFMSDGELQEGQTWEAFEVMAHYELHNMAIVVDANGQQCDGTMESVLNITPMVEKLRAFGTHGRGLHPIRAPPAGSPVRFRRLDQFL